MKEGYIPTSMEITVRSLTTDRGLTLLASRVRQQQQQMYSCLIVLCHILHSFIHKLKTFFLFICLFFAGLLKKIFTKPFSYSAEAKDGVVHSIGFSIFKMCQEMMVGAQMMQSDSEPKFWEKMTLIKEQVNHPSILPSLVMGATA